ncbi:unnamed protein product, partial [Aureobasidium vineae]
CVSGGCRNVGTHCCGSCRTTYYCSKACQKAHWKRHKLTCNGSDAFPPLRSGIFDLMRLPREIYEMVVVGKVFPPEQAEYDELSALDSQPDIRNRRRDYLDALERHRMNTFLIRVQEGHLFDTPNRLGSLSEYVAPFAQRAKKLHIDIVTTKHHPGETGFQACVNTIKRQLHDIVASLNYFDGSLNSLTVRYTSCFLGEVEDLRIDADGLATHMEARVIWVMDPRTNKMRSLNHTEMKQLYLHSANIADAFCALKTPVSNFRIFEDFSGPDLSRISHKFNVSVPPIDVKLDQCG